MMLDVPHLDIMIRWVLVLGVVVIIFGYLTMAKH
jgi:hypothetical protein